MAREHIDLAKVSLAVSRPGIDPRSFISLAIVTAVSVEDVGVICDITLLPSQIPEHATLSPVYGSRGYGLYCPVAVDDMVIVAAPEGDPAHGYRIIGGVWDEGDAPPPDVVQHPEDVLLVVKSGHSCRIAVDGAGDVVIAARGTGKVRLGGESGGAGVARLGDAVAVDETALQTALDGRYQIASPGVVIVGVTAAISTASTKVEST